jgi:hypothetical protein
MKASKVWIGSALSVLMSAALLAQGKQTETAQGFSFTAPVKLVHELHEDVSKPRLHPIYRDTFMSPNAPAVPAYVIQVTTYPVASELDDHALEVSINSLVPESLGTRVGSIAHFRQDGRPAVKVKQLINNRSYALMITTKKTRVYQVYWTGDPKDSQDADRFIDSFRTL